MMTKVLSLISSSLIGLSVLATQGHTNSISIDEEVSRQALHLLNIPQRYQVPMRYEHLKKLQVVKLREARREPRQLAGKKHVIFQESVEIYKHKASEPFKGSFQDTIRVSNPDKTGHKRQERILSRAEFLKLPLRPNTAEHVKRIMPKDLQKISQHELKVWAGFGNDDARHELERRHKGYQALSKKYLAKMIESQYKEPDLPSQVPLYAFAYEIVREKEQWKQMYMEANFILARDPSSFVGRSLLRDVIKLNPHFKYSYYRLHKLEEVKDQKQPFAVNYLRKAASGPHGLAVAQYEYGLYLLTQNKQKNAITWLRKASSQGYWLADKMLLKLYSQKEQDIQTFLKSPKRKIIVKS